MQATDSILSDAAARFRADIDGIKRSNLNLDDALNKATKASKALNQQEQRLGGMMKEQQDIFMRELMRVFGEQLGWTAAAADHTFP